MTTLHFTTNTGTAIGETLGVRVNYDLATDVLTVDNLVLGGGGNDNIQSVNLPIGIGDQLFTWGITLDGGAGNDTITGFNKTDVLIGGIGNDTLNGVSGSTMSGGAGIDELDLNANTTGTFTANLRIVYSAQAAATSVLADGSKISGFEKFVIVAGSGRDTLDLSGDASANGSNFFGDAGNDAMIVDAATRGQVIFRGDAGVDRLVANLGGTAARVVVDGSLGGIGLLTAGLHVGCVSVEGYSVTSGAAADSLTGGSGVDVFNAGAGNDLLTGGLGNDLLTGGLGNDRFAFDAIGGGVDVIADFHNGVGDNDRLSFELADVGALGAGAGGLGLLKAIHFQASSAAVALTADARFIYDTDDGKLRYDADGNGPGAAVLICILTGAPALTAADVLIV